MSNNTPQQKNTGDPTVLDWVNERFPLSSTIEGHLTKYYAPKNLNFWYFFGSLSLLVLVIQLVTGIFLVMNYKPEGKLAFDSVEYIMRDVNWGWLIRYMHSTGASMFFVVVYLHMVRGLLYGSYRKPRELIWIFGVLIFLCLMAEAFMGYLLPWGQMSYWGAQVIINLFGAFPIIGEGLSEMIRGDYVVSDVTLNRFFAFHVIAVPLVLLGLVAAHIVALHEVGSNNPDGVEIKKLKDKNGKPLDGIPFHPYYTVHDIFGVGVFLMIFFGIVFFAPEMGGYFLEHNNFVPADAFKTPNHIAPVWYFTPFYSMLRATTNEMTNFIFPAAIIGGLAYAFSKGKLLLNTKGIILIGAMFALVLGLEFLEAKFWGVVVMGGTVVILGFLPWLDKSLVRSIRYRPTFHKVIYAVSAVNFLMLMYLGTKAPSPFFNVLSQIGTLLYIGFFALMPVWSKLGTFKEVPDRVTFTEH